jgi:hypothetical protein
MERKKVLLLEDALGFWVLKSPDQAPNEMFFAEFYNPRDIVVQKHTLGVLANDQPGSSGKFYVQVPSIIIGGHEFLRYALVTREEFEFVH